MPLSVTVRYPGRACLLGEHCDWAGGASLAVPLPIGVRVEARPGVPGSGVSVATHLGGTPLSGRWELAGSVEPGGGELRFVPAALYALSRFGIPLPDTEISVASDLPAGRGFSSSAAFTLAVLDALARRAGRALGARTLARLAFEVEHDLLGVDCGLLDQIACGEAAPVFIRWDGGDPEVRVVSPGTTFHLVAIALPTPRDTKKILATLNTHHAARSEDQTSQESSSQSRAVRSTIESFAREASVGAAAMEDGDASGLGEAMNRAQESYERLEPLLPELHAPLLRRTCVELRNAGALGAKFSGAGGDGSVITLFASREAALAAVERFSGDRGGAAVYCPIG